MNDEELYDAEDDAEENDRWHLTPWGCLSEVLEGYGIDISHITGRMGTHLVEDFYKGIKIAVVGRIRTGSYDNDEGKKVYTTEVVIEDQEFAESKAASQGGADGSGGNGDKQKAGQEGGQSAVNADGFMNVPDDFDDLPFN